MGDLGFLIPIMGIIMGVSIPITAIKLKHREKGDDDLHPGLDFGK